MFSISTGLFLAREWKWIIAGVTTFLVMLMMLMAGAMSTTSVGTTQPSCNGPITLTGNGNAQKIWNFLTSNQVGLNAIGAAGVLGNMAQESQLNPAEAGGGLCQWIKGRWGNLVAYANQNNEDVNSLATQLGFFLQELRSGQHGSISELNSQSTPALAAAYFEQAFEGAGDPRLDKRIAYANGFYGQFAGMPTVTPVSQQPVIPITCGSSNLPNVPASAQTQKVITYAEQFLGVPYVWGGTTPSGFDCSGLMMYVFHNALGINLPRVSIAQQLVGTRISPTQVQPGDLVFMGNPAFHVGMYIGGGKWIEAPQTGEVVKIANYNPVHFTSASRVIN